jgi:hypothetical protein
MKRSYRSAPVSGLTGELRERQRMSGKGATELREAFGVRPACWRCGKAGGPKAGASSAHSKRFARRLALRGLSPPASNFSYRKPNLISWAGRRMTVDQLKGYRAALHFSAFLANFPPGSAVQITEYETS